MRPITWYTDGRVDIPLDSPYAGPPVSRAPRPDENPLEKNELALPDHPLDSGRLALVGIATDGLTLTFQVDPDLPVTDGPHNPPTSYNRQIVLNDVVETLWRQGYVNDATHEGTQPG